MALVEYFAIADLIGGHAARRERLQEQCDEDEALSTFHTKNVPSVA